MHVKQYKKLALCLIVVDGDEKSILQLISFTFYYRESNQIRVILALKWRFNFGISETVFKISRSIVIEKYMDENKIINFPTTHKMC